MSLLESRVTHVYERSRHKRKLCPTAGKFKIFVISLQNMYYSIYDM